MMRDDPDSPTVPQDARSVDSEVVKPAEVVRCCVVCGTASQVHLTVAPACPEHASPDSLTAALAEARRALKGARRSFELLRDSLDTNSWVKCEAEMALKMMDALAPAAALAGGGGA